MAECDLDWLHQTNKDKERINTGKKRKNIDIIDLESEKTERTLKSQKDDPVEIISEEDSGENSIKDKKGHQKRKAKILAALKAPPWFNTMEEINDYIQKLENYEFKLVRESLREREIIFHIAKNISKPLDFILVLGSFTFFFWRAKKKKRKKKNLAILFLRPIAQKQKYYKKK